MITQQEIDKALNSLPAVGRKVIIKYPNEISKSAVNEKGEVTKPDVRKGVMVQKTCKGNRSNFTVEITAESGAENRGSYRLNFGVTDILTGRVKIQEAK